MAFWRRLSGLWRNLFHKGHVERELDEEVRAYVDLLGEEKAKSGMSRPEARRAALIELGGVEQVKEQVREVRFGNLLGTLVQDLRYGARVLRQHPGFTVVAVLSLALGIGATTAAFSVYDTIFLRPLWYPESARLVGIWQRDLSKPWPEGWEMNSTPTFQDWKKQSQSFEELAQYDSDEWALVKGSERIYMVPIRHVGEGYFHMLGARAALGRLFARDEYQSGRMDSVVISHGAWRRLFGSNPSVVGSSIRVDGKLTQVVGILSPEFQPGDAKRIDLWLALNWVDNRQTRLWFVIGRLKPGVSLQKAQAEMDVIESRLARQYPEQKGLGAHLQPLHDYFYEDEKGQIQSFFGAAVLVLLIACTNVANLLLARGATRQKEMAVRA